MNDADTFLQLLQTGQYLPAIGIALIAIVSLARFALGLRFPWFKTKLGGYLLGFGSAAALYLGAAFRDGQGVSVGVLTMALGAGWAASGGWEMLRDLLEAARTKAAPTKPTLVTLAMIVAALGCSSCKELPDTKPLAPIIDCTLANRGQIESTIKEFKGLLVGEAPNWTAIEEKAVLAGVTIGGCALAEYVQMFLGARRTTPAPVDETWKASSTLERYRERQAGGSTFHTALGDL